jgi:AcrR family transcriptional regulator
MTTPATAGKILAAARAILERDGAAAVTMRSVARQVKITPMAIYRHFSDREGLLNALADQGFAELAAQLQQMALPKGWEAKLLRMADIYLDHALSHPHLFTLMFLTKRPGARRYPQDFQASRSPTASLLMKELEAGMEAGVLRRREPWEIAFHMGALSHGLIMLYLGDRVGASPQDFRELYHTAFRTYFHGLLA